MYSKIGQKQSAISGIERLMQDIGVAMKQSGGKMINMGAGNPLVFDELISMRRKHSEKIIASEEFGDIIGRYGAPKGYPKLIETIKKYFKKEFNREIEEENILITTGSQGALFYGINVFAGEMPDGSRKRIFLPQSPDYVGYGCMALDDDMFVSVPPKPEKTGKHKFKYKLDLSEFPNREKVGAVIYSRPCNPTGNIMTEEEVQKIYDFVEGTDIPVFVDSAYAGPIPNLVYTEMETKFHKNTMYSMSFSKAGLPGERIGIVVGNPKIIKCLESFHSNLALMSAKFGQALAVRAVSSGELQKVSKEIITPRYKKKFEWIEECYSKYMPDEIPWYTHEVEGAMFSFIWFENMPITDEQLYEILKKRGLLVVPGNTFFSGIKKENFKHTSECLRISIAVEDHEIEKGVKILSEVIKEVYNK